MRELANEVGTAAAKVAPPITVAAASVTGWGVQDWMYAVTIAYVALQGAYLVWKWLREARKRES